MLKEITKYISFTTLLLVYLYTCGALYLIAFWSTFNIDISNLVSLVEIPKSFFYPFLITQGFTLLHFLISSQNPIEKGPWLNPTSDKFLVRIFSRPNIYLLISYLFAAFLLSFPKSIILWALSGFFLAFGLAFKIYNIGAIRNIIPNNVLRFYLAQALIITPITSGILGKFNSLSIEKNKNISVIKLLDNVTDNQLKVSNDSSDLKLIGFIGVKLVLSTKNNSIIYLLNQDEYKSIMITKDK